VFTLLLAFFSYSPFPYSPFPYFFNVSAHKTEIQTNLDKSITQAENMFAEYERYAENRKRIYRSKLQSVVNAKRVNPGRFAAFGFVNNGVADSRQIESKMFTLHADLFPTNYEDMKRKSSAWLTDARNTVRHWYPIGIVDVVNEVEKNSMAWLNYGVSQGTDTLPSLVELSKVREKGEQAKDFDYSLSFDDTKTFFTTPGKPTGLSIGLAVAAWALMMLSWFVTKRHTRFPGLKVLFGGGKIINEL
jgi:hypothetical protein